MNKENGTDDANASETQCSLSVGMSLQLGCPKLQILKVMMSLINEYDLDLEDNVMEPLLNYQIAQENIDKYDQVSANAMYSRKKAALIGKYVTVKGKKANKM